jgi:endoglucanase
MKTLFVDKGIPVILGEFGLNMGDNPPYYQWLWVDSLMQNAHDCGIATMVWDNGGLLNRSTHVWREPVRVAIQVQAAQGNKNSLVNTGLAYTLPVSSSDLALPLVLNGNTLSRIKNGDTALVATRDYAVSGATLTINGSYLSGLPSGTTTLSIGFSAGADQRIKLSKS